MEIIPVIDVMGGKVVHAAGGDRQKYPLLQSSLTPSTQPLDVIKDLLQFHCFSTIYIADLDAIIDGNHNEKTYFDISTTFPDTHFLLDFGVKNKADCLKVEPYNNISPVLGSETLVEPSWIKQTLPTATSTLSLDFKNGHFLGDKSLLSSPEQWPTKVIVMSLDHVGSKHGPNFDLIMQIQAKTNSEVIASGGVRDVNDLLLLKQEGVKQVLVASALHDGRITKQAIGLLEQA